MTQAPTSVAPRSGYASEGYARAFGAFGRPTALERSGGWVIVRRVGERADAVGPYPLFACANWSGLGDDLAEREGSLLSVVVVTDPFGRYDERLLHHAFPDLVVRYKDHYVAELDRTPSAFIHPKHRSRARSALRQLTVERCDEPVAHLGEWCGLYDGLIRRHGIVGLSAFSRDSFRFQLSLPGMAAYRAIYQGQTVAMVLSYEHGNEAYYHLSAGSDVGRSLNATHAILWVVLHDLHDAGAQRYDLGAAAGPGGPASAGLTEFKSRWSTTTVPVYLCGRVLDRAGYDAAVRASGGGGRTYFPGYRWREAA